MIYILFNPYHNKIYIIFFGLNSIEKKKLKQKNMRVLSSDHGKLYLAGILVDGSLEHLRSYVDFKKRR